MGTKDRIRKFRKAKKLSTYELSELTGISQSTISKLENGKRKPNLPLLEKIAEALEVSTERLTGESVSCIIEERLEELGRTLKDVSENTGVSLHWLQNLDSFIPGGWANGEIEYKWITRVAEEIGLPASQLRAALARQEIPAYDGPKSSLEEDFADVDFDDDLPSTSPVILPKNVVSVPILGSIPAGKAIAAVQDILGYLDIPAEWTHGDRQYFGLLVKGDSMYPEYLEGDTVIIRKQPFCDSGDDCAVILDNMDSTLKRVRLLDDGIELEAINPMYGPQAVHQAGN